MLYGGSLTELATETIWIIDGTIPTDQNNSLIIYDTHTVHTVLLGHAEGTSDNSTFLNTLNHLYVLRLVVQNRGQ